jgi:hypothetical protein
MKAHRTVLAATVAALAASCAAPALRGFDESDLAAVEPRLLGRWYDPKDDESPVFEVTRAEVGRTYHVAVSGHPKETGEGLSMVAGGIRVGEHLVLDLTLAEEELQPIGEKFGVLLLPTHVFYRIDFEGEDALHVHQLDFGWLADMPGNLVAVRDIPVFTGEPRQLMRVFELSLHDPEAWTEVAQLARAP